MTIVLDPEYLADPDTVYPIRIDPTIEVVYDAEENNSNAARWLLIIEIITNHISK